MNLNSIEDLFQDRFKNLTYKQYRKLIKANDHTLVTFSFGFDQLCSDNYAELINLKNVKVLIIAFFENIELISKLEILRLPTTLIYKSGVCFFKTEIPNSQKFYQKEVDKIINY